MAGIILSWVYIGLIDIIPFIYLNFLTTAGFAIALGFIISFVKKKFAVTSVVGSIVVVLMALFIINIMRGQMWFAMWYSRMYWPQHWGGEYFYFDRSFLNVFLDLRYFIDAIVWIFRYPFEHNLNPAATFITDLRAFNEWGTWGLGADGTPVTGVFLWVIWVVELTIICSIPLVVAAEPVGVFLKDRGVLAKSEVLPYRFGQFSRDELYRIESGEVSVIANKPLAVTGKGHNVALLYDGSERTDYISIHKAPDISKGGISPKILNAMTHGRALTVARLTPDAIESLVKQLDEKHGTSATFVNILEGDENDTAE
ncbi:MAG: hypothetical protein FWE21_08615 [Defluviitaleaceae bacterium]|nr:hypothetical protein [Defluviitaleaceae bacterium]